MALEAIHVEPVQRADACVIWLHGLGADGHDFESIVPQLALPPTVRFAFPHAPYRPVTINARMRMRAWYDIDPNAPMRGGDELDQSADDVEQLVHEQLNDGVSIGRIVLAGFSQGGVVALRLGLRLQHALAGIVALSTFVCDQQRLDELASEESRGTPIFMAHGTVDPMVPFHFAEMSRDLLQRSGYKVDWQQYPIGHSVCPPEVDAIGNFLRRLLKSPEDSG